MPVPPVKTLIFDLGGVILDLSVPHTLETFAEMSSLPREKVEEIYFSAPGFLEYEKGLMDDRAFRDYVRATYSIRATDEAIDQAWNAMLRGIPSAKLDLITQLRDQFQVFLLSNTNAIHVRHINEVILAGEGRTLDSYFHRAYYSHSMRKRKPDAEIFEQVIAENNLVPGETLFLDDYAVNIEGARAVGIRTVHVTSPNLILEYFHA